MSGRAALLAPPDGARLAELAERREWLARLEVAQLLPREGLLWLEDAARPESSASVAVDAEQLVARSAPFDAAVRTVALRSEEVAVLSAIWVELWTEPEPGSDASVLLHYRGLFRRAGGPAAVRLGAWLRAVMAR